MRAIAITCIFFACYTQAFTQINLNQGLKMYLPFSGNAVDVSGNTNVVTVDGPVLTTDRFGDANAAYHFDGFDDYMAIALGQGMQPNYPFTFACWIKLIGTGPLSTNFVFCNSYTSPGGQYFGAIFNVPVTGALQANVGDGGPTNSQHRKSKTAETPLPLGSWHHIAAVVSSATSMRLYVDCAEVDGNYSGSGTGLVYSNGQGSIGRGNGGGGEYFLKADLDEMRFYHRALTTDEVLALYNYPNTAASLDSFPNVFTPNGDGLNETFGLQSTNLISSHLTIYNRWGSVVFETDDIATGWDGGNNTEGVYYYILSFGDCISDLREIHGTVTLLRNE